MHNEQDQDLVDVLAEEFLTRRRNGEECEIEEYLEKYPHRADDIRDVFAALDFVRASQPPVDEIPKIPDYEIIREIGRGGMGIVYEAQQISLGRRVALKVVPQTLLDNEISIKRFELEARTAAQLEHNNIVPVYDFGFEKQLNYFSMRLIDGKGLDEVIADVRNILQQSGEKSNNRRKLLGTLSSGKSSDSLSNVFHPDSETISLGSKTDAIDKSGSQRIKSYYHKAANICLQVADALSYAHQNNVVHRDIKPSNLLLDRTGKVWVADFGLAKNESQDLTTTGNIVGTLRFMSPERMDGNNDLRSDIYSLGVTLYESLSLQPAIQSTNQLKVLEKIRDQQPVRLNTIDSGIPVDLQTIVEKAIEKDPRKRYPTAESMAEDLQLFLQGRPINARRVSQFEHAISWARRNPGIATSLASIVVLVFAGLIGTSIAAWQFRDMAIQQEHLAGVAEKESNENQQNLYYAEMKLAVEAADSPYAKRPLQELLRHWKPKNPAETDRRGFEWYWLNSLLHPNIRKIDDYSWRRVSFTPDGKQFCQYSTNGIALASWPELEDTWTRFLNQDSRFFEKVKLETNSSRIAFISNTEFLAYDPSEMILEVWDWKQDKKLFEVREDGPLNFAWSRDGSLLAVLIPTELPNTKECSIRVYSTDTWKPVRELELPHTTNRFDRPISFSCDGRWLAVGVENKNRIDHENGWILGRYGVVCYETSNWKIERSYFGRKWSVVSGLEWHPTKPELAIRSLSGSICRWVVDNNTSRETELENFMQTIGWDDGGKQVVVAGDGSVRTFDTAMKPFRHWLVSDSHSIFARPHPKTDEIVVVVDDELSPMDGTSLISQSHYPKQVMAGPAIKHLETARWPAKLNWRPDGKQLSSSLDTSTTIWEAATGKPAYIISEHEACSIVGSCFGWNASNQILATYDGEVSWYSANGKVKDKSLAKRFGECDVNQNGSEFYYIQKNESTCVLSRLNLESQAETAVITLPDEKFSFPGKLSPYDQFLALGIGKKLVIVDLNAQKIHTEISLENEIKVAAWKFDGTSLACSGGDGEISVLNMETFETVAKYKGHTGKILALDWAPDGNRLASAGLDKTVHLWDPATGKVVVVFKQDAGVNAVAWSPNGQRLATINLNGETTIYDATLGYEAAVQTFD